MQAALRRQLNLACFATLGAIALLSNAAAAVWPPSDPQEEQATVAFSEAWAAAQRDTRDFGDLQRAAGAGGRIVSYDLQAPFPHVTFVWRGSGGHGGMRVSVYEDGAFSGVISPSDDSSTVVINSFGAFVCPACSPPVRSCGRRPSWIPHDVHWDVFDCETTLLGPMPEQH